MKLDIEMILDVGTVVYIYDDLDDQIYEGEILSIDWAKGSCLVGYESDWYFKHRTMAIDVLKQTYQAVLKNAALIFERS